MKPLLFFTTCLALLFGCEATTVVGSIPCRSELIDVVSIKREKRLGHEQQWGFGVVYRGKTLIGDPESYRGFLPDTFPRRLVGKTRTLEPSHFDFPHGRAINFYLGDLSSDGASDVETVETCLVSKDSELRSLLLKTEKIRKSHQTGTPLDALFVFWRNKKSDLELKFSLSSGEYLTPIPSGAIYYRNKGTDSTTKVGELSYDIEGKLTGIHVFFSPKQRTKPSDTNPAHYRLEGKTLSAYFGVPFVEKSGR